MLACLLLAGCGDRPAQDPPPAPARIARDAVGHYCGMIVVDHPGPKAQIWLAGAKAPLWFSSVRDGIAFTMLAEESRAIRAFYVNDMSRARDWQSPPAQSWMAAADAWYVLDSRRRGGMGAAETVPFSDPVAARAFVKAHGGEIVRFDAIARDDVLGDAR